MIFLNRAVLPKEQSTDCCWSAWADKKKAWPVVVYSLSWVLPTDGVLLVVVMDEDHQEGKSWVLVGREVFRLYDIVLLIFLNLPINFFIISFSADKGLL